MHGRGSGGRARGVRGGAAPQRGGGVMTRRTWAVAILGAWAASLGWLVKREFFRPTGTRLAEAALSVPPGAVYYRLDVGGQQVGFASSTIDTQATSIGVTDMLVLRTPDRKSTRLNSSHLVISYAVFCLKKKNFFYT